MSSSNIAIFQPSLKRLKNPDKLLERTLGVGLVGMAQLCSTGGFLFILYKSFDFFYSAPKVGFYLFCSRLLTKKFLQPPLVTHLPTLTGGAEGLKV